MPFVQRLLPKGPFAGQKGCSLCVIIADRYEALLRQLSRIYRNRSAKGGIMAHSISPLLHMI